VIKATAHHTESMITPSILIVEDERIVAKDLQLVLQSLGYSIAGLASSGEDALRKARECRPGLILMDVRLGGAVDGIEAAGMIREQFDIPVIYLTAFSDPETLIRAKATRPFGYLTKPFRVTDLRAAIEIAVTKHRTESLHSTRRAPGDDAPFDP
jgi:two-component system cell cycle sensor histidine kinase/response regulator CckA